MPLRIVSASESLSPAVDRFNERLRAGGVMMRFSSSPTCAALPPGPNETIIENRYLAVEDDGTVRGAYAIMYQPFWIAGEKHVLGDIRLPISEGLVNPRYRALGAALLSDAHRRHPLMFGLGIGRQEDPAARLYVAAGWKMNPVPFFFHVVRPFRFLRRMRFLRQRRPRRLAADLLALSGLGWLGIKAAQVYRRQAAPCRVDGEGEIVPDFGNWADELWREARDFYPFTAVRDAAALRRLYPAQSPRFLRLQVTQDGRVLGWALLIDSQFQDHKYFGALRVGTLVDCFAAPQHALAVVETARRWLMGRGVDLIVSNQAHHAWGDALRAAGFLAGPTNFFFTSSPPLTYLLQARHVQRSELHLNRGDGDGPTNL
jgi:hypothetical protein